MTIFHEQLITDSAIAYMRAGLPNYLPGNEARLIDGCMEVLQTRHDITAHKAKRVSLSALAEVQSRKGCRIDMELSNSNMVVLHCPERKESFAFQAWRLMEIAEKYGVNIS